MQLISEAARGAAVELFHKRSEELARIAGIHLHVDLVDVVFAGLYFQLDHFCDGELLGDIGGLASGLVVALLLRFVFRCVSRRQLCRLNC